MDNIPTPLNRVNFQRRYPIKKSTLDRSFFQEPREKSPKDFTPIIVNNEVVDRENINPNPITVAANGPTVNGVERPDTLVSGTPSMAVPPGEADPGSSEMVNLPGPATPITQDNVTAAPVPTAVITPSTTRARYQNDRPKSPRHAVPTLPFNERAVDLKNTDQLRPTSVVLSPRPISERPTSQRYKSDQQRPATATVAASPKVAATTPRMSTTVPPIVRPITPINADTGPSLLGDIDKYKFYDSRSETEQNTLRELYRFKYIDFNQKHKDLNIGLPVPTEPLSLIVMRYDSMNRRSQIYDKATYYRMALIAYWLFLEWVSSWVVAKGHNFAQSQVEFIQQYDSLLIELSEKNVAESFSKLPPLWRILILGLIHISVFIVMNYLGGAKPEIIQKILSAINVFAPGLTGNTSGPAFHETLLANAGTQAINGGGGLMDMLKIFLGGNNGDADQQQKAGENVNKPRRHFGPRHGQ